MSATVTAPAATPAGSAAKVSERLRKKPTRHVKERVIEFLLFGAAMISVFTTAAIVYILVKESWIFFQTVPLTDFLFDTQWTPLFDDAHYGIMVLLSGTITSSAVALAVAIPLCTIIAIYLSEFAPFAVREIAKPFLELLGGVPTIVYGYFALVFLTPLLQKIYPDLPGFNLLSAGIVMGIMIIPYVSSISEDAMRAVPMSLREAVKPVLEMLGGVPTIVYGYFALLFVTPLLQRIYPDLPGFNLLAAGIVMGIMIIPYVASLSEDAMRAVPM